MFSEDSSDCFCGDSIGDDGIDVFSDFNSIFSLASINLGNNSMSGSSRELGGMTRRRMLSVGHFRKTRFSRYQAEQYASVYLRDHTFAVAQIVLVRE